MVCLPAFHVAGLLSWFMPSVKRLPVHFCLQQPFDMNLVAKVLEKEKVERVTFVPPVLLLFVRAGFAKPRTYTALRHIVVGAAPLGATLQSEAMEALGGVPIIQVWGMTETTGAVTCASPLERIIPGSAGKVVPGTELRLVDDNGQDVQHGAQGEVWIRSPVSLTITGFKFYTIC